jgi:lipopolysaccharide transport protein LptA
MARSIASLAILFALATGAQAGAPQLDEDQPIQLEARSSDFDYKSSTLIFKAVRIAQGRLWIESDEATANGLDFKGSVWRFAGNVKMGLPDGTIQSDQALITFANNLVSVAEISGSPASFEQKRPNGVARGRAKQIEYRPGSATVRLTGDAWLSDGTNEMSGATLVYDLNGQRVVANPDDQGDQRVRLTIQPKKTPKPVDATEEKHTP